MKASDPLFTLVTVTYNAAATLERTMESVKRQTFRRFEHLIIDGGSRDDTLRIARRYDCRVTSEPDRGIYDAMNKGIRQARGQYIIFLNAGDKLHDDATLEQVARQADGAPAVLYGETDLVDNDGRFLRHRRLRAPERLTWRSFLNGMLVCHQSFYVRADLARACPYDLRYRLSADYDWTIRIMRLAHERGLALTNTHLVLTDYLSEGMTTRNHRASLLERLRIMARHYGWPRAIGQHLWFVLRAVVKR